MTNYIFFYNWWPGFHEKYDANHIGFYEELFSLSDKLKNFQITNDINIANVLVEAGKPDDKIRNIKKWKYTINYIGEPVLPDFEKYNLVLTSVNDIENVVDLPLSIAYIHCNHFFPLLIAPRNIECVPSLFCSFVVSNDKCVIRNNIFKRLNAYKKVDSMGRYANNVGGNVPYPYWSREFIDVIGKYKFMICGENTKMATYSTEKIVNPYLAKVIPIYWGAHNITNIFNHESMLFLEDETDESFEKLINKVIELDNDHEKYLEFVNRPIFNQHNQNFIEQHYNLNSLAKKIDQVLSVT
jgi:hypothetical protein